MAPPETFLQSQGPVGFQDLAFGSVPPGNGANYGRIETRDEEEQTIISKFVPEDGRVGVRVTITGKMGGGKSFYQEATALVKKHGDRVTIVGKQIGAPIADPELAGCTLDFQLNHKGKDRSSFYIVIVSDVDRDVHWQAFAVYNQF